MALRSALEISPWTASVSAWISTYALPTTAIGLPLSCDLLLVHRRADLRCTDVVRLALRENLVDPLQLLLRLTTQTEVEECAEGEVG
jgi:hypothetical protein